MIRLGNHSYRAGMRSMQTLNANCKPATTGQEDAEITTESGNRQPYRLCYGTTWSRLKSWLFHSLTEQLESVTSSLSASKQERVPKDPSKELASSPRRNVSGPHLRLNKETSFPKPEAGATGPPLHHQFLRGSRLLACTASSVTISLPQLIGSASAECLTHAGTGTLRVLSRGGMEYPL